MPADTPAEACPSCSDPACDEQDGWNCVTRQQAARMPSAPTGIDLWKEKYRAARAAQAAAEEREADWRAASSCRHPADLIDRLVDLGGILGWQGADVETLDAAARRLRDDRDAWANATYSETPAELSKAFADAAIEHVRLSGELAAERQAREAAEAIAHAAITAIDAVNIKVAAIFVQAHAIGLVGDADMATMREAMKASKAAAGQLRAALSAAKETP